MLCAARSCSFLRRNQLLKSKNGVDTFPLETWKHSHAFLKASYYYTTHFHWLMDNNMPFLVVLFLNETFFCQHPTWPFLYPFPFFVAAHQSGSGARGNSSCKYIFWDWYVSRSIEAGVGLAGSKIKGRSLHLIDELSVEITCKEWVYLSLGLVVRYFKGWQI